MQLHESEVEKIMNKKKAERRKLALAAENGAPVDPILTATKIEVHDSEVVLPYDSNFYIIACKGNVYQSCGDDEQSLLQYMAGWESSSYDHHRDWEMLFINSIGLLAYYNLHYELAWKCFHKVAKYREKVDDLTPLIHYISQTQSY